ncbi:hypothetical protein [Chloroflexus sp.]
MSSTGVSAMLKGIILLVEHEPDRRNRLTQLLNRLDWAVVAVSDVRSAYDDVNQMAFDYLIIDRINASLRDYALIASRIPRIFNSHWLDNHHDQLVKLVPTCSAERFSCLWQRSTKPAHISPDIATKPSPHPQALVVDTSSWPTLMVNAAVARALFNNREIPLNQCELEVIHYLSQLPSQIASFESLADLIYKRKMQYCEARELVKARLARLRRKLPGIIQPVRGYGFLLGARLLSEQ